MPKMSAIREIFLILVAVVYFAGGYGVASSVALPLWGLVIVLALYTGVFAVIGYAVYALGNEGY
jgi:membrane protein YdbS with pleckstrin-like domain